MPLPETPRLLLREFAPADAPFILRLLNERSFIENIADKGVRTEADAVRYLEDGPLASYRKHGHGLWAVVLKTTGLPIGMCGLIKRDALPDVDIGYAFLPEAWGQGHAREAAAACVEQARTVLGLRRLVAVVSPGNAPSIKLLQKLGFSREGALELTPGDPVELFARALGQGA